MKVKKAQQSICDILNDHSHALQRQDIDGIVSVFFEQIAAALSRGDRVEQRGFGSFSVKRREARMARNPRTGPSVLVVDKPIPFFRAGKPLHRRLNHSD
jgi:integration host factor subunit beta